MIPRVWERGRGCCYDPNVEMEMEARGGEVTWLRSHSQQVVEGHRLSRVMVHGERCVRWPVAFPHALSPHPSSRSDHQPSGAPPAGLRGPGRGGHSAVRCHREAPAQGDVGAGRPAGGAPAWPAAEGPGSETACGAGSGCPRWTLQLRGRERGREGGEEVCALRAG